MTRVLHISDLHIPSPVDKVPLLDWIGKRYIGWLNYRFRREAFFEETEAKLRKLAELMDRYPVDALVISGDYTTTGTVQELEYARSKVQPLIEKCKVFVTVPGNHDIYLRNNVREKRFERFFGEFLTSDCPDLSVDGPWPLVRLCGDDVAFVCLNSAKPNPIPWKSSGEVNGKQLQQVPVILKDPRLQGRFIFIVTHHGVFRANGEVDFPHHGLANSQGLLESVKSVERGAILHGHIHTCFFHGKKANKHPHIFCAGSTTYSKREGLWLLDVDNEGFGCQRGTWDGHGFQISFRQAVPV